MVIRLISAAVGCFFLGFIAMTTRSIMRVKRERGETWDAKIGWLLAIRQGPYALLGIAFVVAAIIGKSAKPLILVTAIALVLAWLAMRLLARRWFPK